MWILWLREWRELRHRWVAGLLLLGLGSAIARWAPPRQALPALSALAALSALSGAAQRLWRERRTGGLGRLFLTGMPAGQLLAVRVLARAAVTAVLVTPPACLLAWRQPADFSFPGLVAAMLGTVASGTAAGAAIGLWARHRRHLYLCMPATAAGLWLLTWLSADLPRQAPPPAGLYGQASVLGAGAAPAALAGGAALLAVCWLAPYLLADE